MHHEPRTHKEISLNESSLLNGSGFVLNEKVLQDGRSNYMAGQVAKKHLHLDLSRLEISEGAIPINFFNGNLKDQQKKSSCQKVEDKENSNNVYVVKSPI